MRIGRWRGCGRLGIISHVIRLHLAVDRFFGCLQQRVEAADRAGRRLVPLETRQHDSAFGLVRVDRSQVARADFVLGSFRRARFEPACLAVAGIKQDFLPGVGVELVIICRSGGEERRLEMEHVVQRLIAAQHKPGRQTVRCDLIGQQLNNASPQGAGVAPLLHGGMDLLRLFAFNPQCSFYESRLRISGRCLLFGRRGRATDIGILLGRFLFHGIGLPLSSLVASRIPGLAPAHPHPPQRCRLRHAARQSAARVGSGSSRLRIRFNIQTVSSGLFLFPIFLSHIFL